MFFYILVSAVFYAASFLRATILWPFSFVFSIPLFSLVFFSWRMALLHGFVWGLVAHGFTLSTLVALIIEQGCGYERFLYAGGFVFYFSFGSAAWFVSTYYMARLFGCWHGAWFFTTFFYFAWIAQGCLQGLTGVWQGYVLGLPLLPLTEAPCLLGALFLCGWFVLLAALFLFQIGVVIKNRWFMVVGVAPFLVGILLYRQGQACLVGEICPVPGSFYEKTPYERAQEVATRLVDACSKNREAQAFVLPESAFPHVLNHTAYPIAMWNNQLDLAAKYLIIPAHYRDLKTGALYNSVYVVHANRVVMRYDKKALVPFFEAASILSFLGADHRLILKGVESFTPGSGATTWGYEKQTIFFCVCSELLWNFPEVCRGMVIVVVHDGQYHGYFQNLLALCARFRALQTKSSVLYVSWTQAFWFDGA